MGKERITDMDYSGTNSIEVCMALATDNYEEVKQKVKKTFYQAVRKEVDNNCVKFASNWYLYKKQALKNLVPANDFEIIEREFEIE